MAENEGVRTPLFQGIIMDGQMVTFDLMMTSLTEGGDGSIESRPRVPMSVRSNMGHTLHRVEVVVTCLKASQDVDGQYDWTGEVVATDGEQLVGLTVDGEIDFTDPFWGTFHCYA